MSPLPSSSYSVSRLERALPRIEREWLPFNRAHLDKIIAGFKAGAYDIDPERFIEEIAQDIGAITWLIHQAIAEGAHGENPLEIVGSLSPTRAIEMLELRKQSSHSLQHSTQEQLLALRTSAVALGAAIGFAPSTDVPVRDAMGAELLLHVGRLLVAWNYPLAFARAVKASSSGQSIDDRLAAEIGFSPMMLSHLLADRWHVDDRFSRLTEDTATIAGERGKSLARLCEISEALAAAEAPELFPDAKERFDDASRTVKDVLGTGGLKTLEDQIATIVGPYREILGSRFCKGLGIELGAMLEEHTLGQAIPESALGGSRLEVRAEVRRLISEINPSTVDVALAKVSMESLIPLCGFSAGCLYVFDPFTKVFRQRLSIGTWHRPLQQAIHEFAPGELPQQLSAAFNANQTQVSNGDTMDIPSFLVAPLGTSTRIGVLCFEAFLLSLDDSGTALSHTRAIRLVLERALKA